MQCGESAAHALIAVGLDELLLGLIIVGECGCCIEYVAAGE